MEKRIGYCEICNTQIEVTFCCSSFDCGCMGLPIDHSFCSNKCYDEYMNKIKQNDTNGKS